MPLTFLLKYWKIIGMALVVTGAFLTGYKFKSNSCEVEKQKIIWQYTQIIQDEVDRQYQISVEYEERITELRSQSRDIIETVEVEVVKPIYRDCRLPESGVNILNDTIKKFNESRKK
jgi:hypothetical protein